VIDPVCPFLAENSTEQVLQRLLGRREPEDALLQLEVLTNEEILMMVAMNVEGTRWVSVRTHSRINSLRVIAKTGINKLDRLLLLYVPFIDCRR
jgi:hypothetical protein